MTRRASALSAAASFSRRGKGTLFVECAFRVFGGLFRLWFAVTQGLAVAVLLISIGCGGGGSAAAGGGGNPPPSPSFSLSLSSSSLYISTVATGSITVNVTGSNGFDSSVSITVSNLPSGVTISPSSANILAGQSQQFTFSAATSTSASTSPVSVTGNSGTQSQQVALDLEVAAGTGKIALSRTRYVATNAVQPYTVLFDSANNRFFMSDPGSNQIFVLDGTTQKLIGSIVVPGAYGMDETPDHSILYAGTQIGDVYAIDPAKMVVTSRYIASHIGTKGYQAYVVQVMANGELALLGGQGGISDVDGYSSFAFWDPATNALQTGQEIGGCAGGGYIFTFAASGDRSLLVLENQNVSGMTASEICTVNPVTQLVNSIPITGSPVVPTPDGKSILVLVFGISAQIDVLDAQTLIQTATFQVGDFPSGTYMVVSPDSSTVYLAPELGGIACAFNISTGAQIGWIPDIYTEPIGTWITAIDNTGLVAGVNVEGIGFLDAAAMQTGPVGLPHLNGYVSPNTGPVSGGTEVNTYFPPSSDIAAVYFGQTPATAITSSSSQLYATTPLGSSGAVDVTLLMSDGGANYLPEAFSYGPSILEVTPNASTADGGGTGVIFGFGFGSITGNEQIPQGLQVSVGGQTVPITAFNPSGYSYGTAPTALESLSFTIPAGAAGTVSDISVTTPSGAATLNGGMQYFPAVQQVALSGTASLAQGIYDPTRKVYYFTDAAEIRVYSRSGNQWLTPIQVPAAPSGTTHRLWGMALSPNGSNLAVADMSAGMIYLINPDSPASVQSFVFNQAYVSGTPVPSTSTSPAAVAVSNAGEIYIASFTTGGTGFDAFFKLQPSSGQVTDYGLTDCAMAPLYKLAISSDNSLVFLNDGGIVGSVHTAGDQLTIAAAEPGGCDGDYDLTLSSGQATFEASSYLYDENLNGQSYLVLSDRDSSYISYVYGTQLSPDGTLLFQPSTNGIDVIDGRLGILLTRIALPVSLSQNYDALVADGEDNVLIAITGTSGSGIALVDLSSVVEPSPLPYATRPIVGRNAKASANDIAQRLPSRAEISGAHYVPKSRVPHVVNRFLVRPINHNAP